MKRSSTVFLQTLIVLIGVTILGLMLWEPHLEGRNAHATLFEVYFKDPFLAYGYVASIAFFVALYKAFKLMGHLEQNEIKASISALRAIKYSSITLAAFVIGAEGYLAVAQRGKDDIAGGVAIGLLIILASIVTATTAAVFEKRLQSGSK